MKILLFTFLLIQLSLLSYCQTDQYPKPEFIDKPYILVDSTNKLLALEENQILMKTKGASILYIMANSPSSLTAISDSLGYSFIIDLRNQEIVQGLVLYKVEQVKEGRALVLKGSKAKEKLAENTIKLNFKEIGNGLYKIVPQNNLEPGEYAFALVWTSFTFRVK